jgi:hypothetical protein
VNADTCHGGVRPKRCLPAEFHSGTAHQKPPKALIDPNLGPTHAFCVPKSRQT